MNGAELVNPEPLRRFARRLREQAQASDTWPPDHLRLSTFRALLEAHDEFRRAIRSIS